MSVDLTEIQGASGGGGSSVIPGIPAANAANPQKVNDILIIICGYGNSAAAAPTLTANATGWATVQKTTGGDAAYYGGAGSWGSLTGPRGVIAFWKVDDGTVSVGPTITNGGSGTDRAIRASMHRISWSNATAWATPVAVGGTDTSAGTGYDVNPGIALGLASGDAVLTGMAWAPHTSTTSGSISSSITDAGALPPGSTTQRITGNAANGNGIRLNTYSAGATAGETGTPRQQLTMTASVDGGPGIFIRLRTTGQPPVANGGVDQDVEPWSTVTLDGGLSASGSPIATYTWTQTGGTTVTLSGTGATRTFQAPASVAGETLTFTLTVTDSMGATSAADTVLVNVLKATELAWVSGAWHPVRILSE